MSHIDLPTGILIAFEGIDGAGKTTQANRLRDFLAAKGFDVVLTKEPTRGKFGQQLRDSARSGRLPPDVELELFLKDRREHVRDLLEPGLREGKIIIVDRYYFSTVAYQGARGLDPKALLAKNEEFAPCPDLLVILDIHPHVGLSRVAGRGDVADLFEDALALAKSRAIFDNIRAPYALHLDATLAMDDIEATVRQHLYDGPLLRRMCSTAREEGVDYCGHMHSGACEWLKAGQGFLPPVSPKTSAQIHAAIADDNLSVEQKLEAILNAAKRR